MCILLILSALIFNEILVINICGLAKNTKLFLEYEAENENSINEEKEDNEDIEIYESKFNIGIQEIEFDENSWNNHGISF